MTADLPPEDEPLNFARRNSTRTVHITEWVPDEPHQQGYSPGVPVPFAEGLVGLLLQRHGMLCGQKIRLLSGGPESEGTHVAGDDFEDDDLCFRCVTKLGDQQWRAFHADSRGCA